MSLTLTPPPQPHLPPAAYSNAAAVAVQALRDIRATTCDKRAFGLADAALRSLGE